MIFSIKYLDTVRAEHILYILKNTCAYAFKKDFIKIFLEKLKVNSLQSMQCCSTDTSFGSH